jgi:hypothetical protein
MGRPGASFYFGMLQGKSVSPEDYTTLWGWITFSWVWPLVERVCVSPKVYLTMHAF